VTGPPRLPGEVLYIVARRMAVRVRWVELLVARGRQRHVEVARFSVVRGRRVRRLEDNPDLVRVREAGSSVAARRGKAAERAF
jgi:hypothetical protein